MTMTAAERRRQMFSPRVLENGAEDPRQTPCTYPPIVYVCIVHIMMYNNNIIPAQYDIDYTRRRRCTRFFGNPYPFVVVYIIFILIYIIFYVNAELTTHRTTACCKYARVQSDALSVFNHPFYFDNPFVRIILIFGILKYAI